MNFYTSWGAFMGFGILIGILFLAFWIWMIIDCAQRRFRKEWEKFLWLAVIVFISWIGALVYFIVVKMFNQRGIVTK